MTETALLHPERIFAEFPNIEEIEFGELLSISLSSSTTTSTHGMHRYPAKYMPQVPRWAIKQFSVEGDVVLDPFAGSGTTLLEASNLGRNSIGIDLDPLACLIAGAKVTPLETGRLEVHYAKLLEGLVGSSEPLEVPLDGVENFDHWFSRQAWSDLSALLKRIDAIDASSDERRFFRVVFSSILRAVSNADDQSQKTYVSGTLKKSPPPVVKTFQKAFQRALKGQIELSEIASLGSSSVANTSSTSIPLEDESVDLIVTSPPYLDSVDYMYNMMLEYFWLGKVLGVESRKDYNLRRRGYVGAKRPADTSDIPTVISSLIHAENFPQYRKDVVGPYFDQLRRHFIDAARVLKDGSRYVLVIGNSRTREEMLPLHDALIALASEADLHLEHAFGYRIRRHYMKFPRKGRGGIILMDWVISLRKGVKRSDLPSQLPRIDKQLPPDAVAH